MPAARSNSPFSSIEKIVKAARASAEAGVAEELADLVPSGKISSRKTMKPSLLARLEAEAHCLGEGDFPAGLDLLKEEIAYREWHYRLFASFLSAAGYADYLLPVNFSNTGRAGQNQISPAAGQALDRLVESMPLSIFANVENLGWLYQFWQNTRKQNLQRGGRKIGGADLGPATQLFTEDYLVRFLLENTLGAWWAVHHPASTLLDEIRFLRRHPDGRPAAGGYPGWPEKAAVISIMDPCCGTGNFLLAAFHLLRRMRMEEEGLSAAEAAAAVLQENLFGLDLDPHCVHITTLVLLLEAFKIGVDTSHLQLNVLPVSPPVFRDENGKTEDPLALQLRNLLEQFPEAGSLLDPTSPVFSTPKDSLVPWGLSERQTRSPGPWLPVSSPPAEYGGHSLFGQSSEDLARVAHLLSRRYVLVATNVPYLARRKQTMRLRQFLQTAYPLEKADLATAFLRRSLKFLQPGGTAALVTPQNWLFLGAYQAMRRDLLASFRLDFLVKIGEWGFRSASAAGAFTALVGISAETPHGCPSFFGLDAASGRNQVEKVRQLQAGQIQFFSQAAQLQHPEARIILAELMPGSRLGDFADSLVGIQTGDNPFYMLRFWELPDVKQPWDFCLTPAGDGDLYGGRECVLRWEAGCGRLQQDPGARVQGLEALGRSGVAVLRVRNIRAFHYAGELYDQNVATILPKDPAHLPAIQAFCASPEFPLAVRQIDQKLNVTNGTLAKVPFDLERWQRVAADLDQSPVRIGTSSDPRNWLFAGDPANSTAPLQVAVARLLGYCWPGQPPDDLDEFAAPDGILPLRTPEDIPSAAGRLRCLLNAYYSQGWSSQREAGLLAAAGHPGIGLEGWLRDHFFREHCRLFRNRPFIWHIWDGRRDGFAALVNYHRFSGRSLDLLIEGYLAEWIDRQSREVKTGQPGAAERLAAAQALYIKLSAIRTGQPPYDLYVRWKSLARQSLGWDPDLNDGVRMNLRPFVSAGVLRARFNIHWDKDRGLNQDGSERLNDLHYSREAKEAART